MGNYGANYKTQYTCSKLQFCNPEGGPSDAEAVTGGRHLNEFSQQDVWKMKDKASFDACDFTDSELMGTTGATSCVEIAKDDLTAEGEKDYYASKENCEAGQKLAVTIGDWESSASQCSVIALHVPPSSRLRTCDCDYSKKPFSARYGGLCAYAYQEACLSVMMPDDECCDAGTCLSKLEVWDTQEGRDHEMARREDCNDEIPGNCYNMNGFATDVSQDGSTDCCSQTCSSCGSETASGASFEVCTSNDPNNTTATCGRLSRYAQEDVVCDFSECPRDSHWGTNNNALWTYMGLEKPTTSLDPPGKGATDIAEAEQGTAGAAESANEQASTSSSTDDADATAPDDSAAASPVSSLVRSSMLSVLVVAAAAAAGGSSTAAAFL